MVSLADSYKAGGSKPNRHLDAGQENLAAAGVAQRHQQVQRKI